ncbi:MAG TPA: Chromate resistance protein ChrB [Thermomicrobiaceae bacterium]|nr:Chromate resistance protein ChrB [Thermomicrobiaceae bacterium]
MEPTWLLLIYTVPAEPSRKRAAVWRELKRAGAVAVRDGVWALPEREETRSRAQTIAGKVTELGGQATLVQGARVDAARSADIVASARSASAREYQELIEEAGHFLAHVQREHEHRNVTFHELEELEADLGKLRHWSAQVVARDYFAAAGRTEVEHLLARCDELLESFLEYAFRDAEARG